MKTLLIIIPAIIILITPIQAEEKPKPSEPESRLIVIGGHLLRVTGDEVKVLWIHPKERPWQGINVAPGIDTSK